jgi:hypothetical protein
VREGNWSSDDYHECMVNLSRPLSGIVVTELSRAERQIFEILAGYMVKAKVGEEWVAKSH